MFQMDETTQKQGTVYFFFPEIVIANILSYDVNTNYES